MIFKFFFEIHREERKKYRITVFQLDIFVPLSFHDRKGFQLIKSLESLSLIIYLKSTKQLNSNIKFICFPSLLSFPSEPSEPTLTARDSMTHSVRLSVGRSVPPSHLAFVSFFSLFYIILIHFKLFQDNLHQVF